ncbi:MAG: TlpA disulfide reductase family protein [Ilumatobacteraceae bacterium]
MKWLILATCGVATMMIAACKESGNDSLNDVTFEAADGASVSVGDFRGQPLVLNLWATNCAPCVHEMPALDQIANEFTGVVQVIGVNVLDTPQNAAAFAADLGVDYPQYTDPDGRLSSALSVTGLPATGFFNAEGELIEVHQGAYTVDELRTAIEQNFPDANEGVVP